MKGAVGSPPLFSKLLASTAHAVDRSVGWSAFNLNPAQHRESLRRMADFDSEIVAVGHGEPIRSGGRRHVRELVDGLG